jgi:hypothetical protein
MERTRIGKLLEETLNFKLKLSNNITDDQMNKLKDMWDKKFDTTLPPYDKSTQIFSSKQSYTVKEFMILKDMLNGLGISSNFVEE